MGRAKVAACSKSCQIEASSGAFRLQSLCCIVLERLVVDRFDCLVECWIKNFFGVI